MIDLNKQQKDWKLIAMIIYDIQLLHSKQENTKCHNFCNSNKIFSHESVGDLSSNYVCNVKENEYDIHGGVALGYKALRAMICVLLTFFVLLCKDIYLVTL